MPVVLTPGFRNPPTPFRPVDRIPFAQGGGQIGAPPTQTTICYVRKTGSDSNGGTSPSDAWLTIQKALTTAAVGSTIYVGGGTYRETLTPSITPTTGSPVSVIADADGSFTGDAGAVIVTAYTTDDKTVPSSGSSGLNVNGKSNLSFQNLMFVCGRNTLITATARGSQNITFRDCAFMTNSTPSGRTTLSLNASYGAPINWLFDRCDFFGVGNVNVASISGDTGVGPDYDLNVLFQNCRIFSGGTAAINCAVGGSGAGHPGGIRLKNCFWTGGQNLVFTAANFSTTIPAEVKNCVCFAGSGSVIVNATTSGQIIEDYNLFYAASARTNVTAGSHTISDGTYAPLFHFGQERVWGGTLRPFTEPMASSPFLAFGAYDTGTGMVDLLQRPRPATPTRWAAGALERGNNFGSGTLAEDSDSSSIQITGSGSQDFDVPVNAGAVTFSIYCQFDSSYQGPYPRFMVLANGEAKVGQYEISFDPNAQGVWQQRSITLYPTGNGIVTVRVISDDTSGTSVCTFDAFTAA